MNTGGWDIGFVHQPANSPADCDTLDLTFFHAIQSLQYQNCPLNIDELIAHVHKAFDELPLDICCEVWTTAQIAMNQILIQNGNNNYKLPYIGKLKIEKSVGGNISMRLPCCALIDGGALDCQYITTFMSNGKFIVVFTVAVIVHRRLSSSIASLPLHPYRRPQRRRHPSAPSLSPSPSIRDIEVAYAVRHCVAIAVTVIVLVLRRAVAVAIVIDVICAHHAVKGGIVIVLLCLTAYTSSSLPISAHHSHPLFFLLLTA